MKPITDQKAALLGLACAFTLGACGGGGSNLNEEDTGTLSLAITDAPVDNVEEVWVQFTGVRVKPSNGPEIAFTFDTPMDLDLLTLTGDNTEALLNGEKVPAGDYEWIALDVNAELDSTMDSFVVDDMGGMVELRVPSGSEQGLRLVSGFTVPAGGSASFVIDWDLRSALTDPEGQQGYFLRPALRISNLAEVGSISGNVADALVMADTCANDMAEDTGNLVYVFDGADVTPVDIDGTDPDPLTTATVAQDSDAAGAYTYTAHFLSPGDYTVAFTCQGLDENPEAEDGLEFVGAQNATVMADETTSVDFE